MKNVQIIKKKYNL